MRRIVYWFHLKDKRMAYYIFKKWRNRTMERWLTLVTHLGDSWFSIFSMIVLAVATRFDLRGLIALTASHFIVEVIKRSISRKRPYDQNRKIVLYGDPLQDYSFPSGHTSAAFTVATALTMTMPTIFSATYLLACIVGFSRIYLGYHYPTDVLIGAIIGSGSAYLIYLI